MPARDPKLLQSPTVSRCAIAFVRRQVILRIFHRQPSQQLVSPNFRLRCWQPRSPAIVGRPSPKFPAASAALEFVDCHPPNTNQAIQATATPPAASPAARLAEYSVDRFPAPRPSQFPSLESEIESVVSQPRSLEGREFLTVSHSCQRQSCSKSSFWQNHRRCHHRAKQASPPHFIHPRHTIFLAEIPVVLADRSSFCL